jgi:hypothetical protein
LTSVLNEVFPHGIHFNPSPETRKRCPYRSLMLAVLWEAASYYHIGQSLKQKRNIKTEEDYKNQPRWVREELLEAKLAWEWFTQPSTPGGKGFTFKRICREFDVSPEKMWATIKKLPNIAKQLGVYKSEEMHEGIAKPKGEGSSNSKIKRKDVLEIRRMARTCSQNSIARIMGVSATTVSEIVSGRRWGHVV